MKKKVSRIISLCILALALIALLMALQAPTATLVPVSAQDAKAFDEKIVALEQAHLQGASQTAHITENELSSKLQQSIDQSSANPQGSVVLKRASVHMKSDGFVGVFTLSLSGKEIYLTMTGTLATVEGRLQIEPSAGKLGRLPIPAAAFRSLLEKQFDSPEGRQRLQLPDFIKDVRIENAELLVEAK